MRHENENETEHNSTADLAGRLCREPFLHSRLSTLGRKPLVFFCLRVGFEMIRGTILWVGGWSRKSRHNRFPVLSASALALTVLFAAPVRNKRRQKARRWCVRLYNAVQFVHF